MSTWAATPAEAARTALGVHAVVHPPEITLCHGVVLGPVGSTWWHQ